MQPLSKRVSSNFSFSWMMPDKVRATTSFFHTSGSPLYAYYETFYMDCIGLMMDSWQQHPILNTPLDLDEPFFLLKRPLPSPMQKQKTNKKKYYLHVSPGRQGPATEVLRRFPLVELHGARGRWVRSRCRWGVQGLRIVASQFPLCCRVQLDLIIAPIHLARPDRNEEESKDENLRMDRQM